MTPLSDSTVKRQSPHALLLAIAALSPIALGACTTVSFALANLPATFGPYRVQRDISYGPLDRQKLDVYAPEGAAASRPIVVFLHGGGWVSGSKEKYRFVADALTDSGYVAVVPNYRLYPEAKFPAFVEDAARAVAWTKKHAAKIGGDERKIFLMGHSAGAQIAAMLALNADYLARVGVSRSDVKGLIGLAGPYDFLPLTDEYLKEVFGPESRYPESQPVNFVDADASPALLIHGETDQVVWPKNSRSLAMRMRASGVAVTERYYAAMSHADVVAALSVYFRNSRPVMRDIGDFIRGRTELTIATGRQMESTEPTAP